MRPSSLLRALVCLLVTAACSTTFAHTITVQNGDTLWGLALKHSTDVATLRSLNNLSSDALQPGQTLKVSEDEQPAAAAPATSVTVRPGDTLYDIAIANSISIEDLIAFNDLDGTLIHPGQELLLSGGDNVPAPLTVTVGVGDSLWVLGRRHDSTVAAIAAANGILATAILRVGDKLTIPGRYSSSELAVGGPAPAVIIVAKGDTLWDIARRYDSDISALKSTNNLTSDRLVAGQQLRIMPGTELAATRAAVPAIAAPSSSPAVTGVMIWPLEGIITSRFGYRQLRVSGSNFHSGLDIDGNTGDPVHAAREGVVTFSGWHGGYGKLVIVSNGDTDYYYGHASELIVEEGAMVNVGDLLALVGSTGNSTGPHLHFEVRVNNEAVDPLPLLESYAQR